MSAQEAILVLRDLERQVVERERVEMIPPADVHVDAGRGARDFLTHEGDRRRDDLEKAMQTPRSGDVDHDDRADMHMRGSTRKRRQRVGQIGIALAERESVLLAEKVELALVENEKHGAAMEEGARLWRLRNK